MRFSLRDQRHFLIPAAVAAMLAAAGCQSGDPATALDPGKQAGKTEEKVTEAELRAYCPRVALRDGTAFFATYAKGGDNDPTKLVYQASISDVTRTCRTVDGAITMNVAIAGRIVPGPAFTAGTVTLPIRIAAMRGDEALYAQVHRHQVSVTDASVATQFVFNDPNVSFVLPADRAVQVFAGYDRETPRAAQ